MYVYIHIEGDHIKITVSPYPVKTYSSCDASNDWFSSVQSCLLWNNRQRQKSFVVVEGDQMKQKKAENMFACIRTEEDNMPNTSNFDEVMDQDDNRQEQQYELNPWSDDELSREDGFKLDSKI